MQMAVYYGADAIINAFIPSICAIANDLIR